MRRSDEVEVLIEDFEFPATGIGHAEGVRLKVKGAYPCQVVKVRPFKIRKDRARGRLMEVVRKASYEVEPPCPHFGRCGGCISQMVPLDLQRKFKEEEVERLFDREGIDMGEYLGISGVKEQYEYRNKMEFTFGDEVKDGVLCLGMHVRGMKNSVLTTEACMLVDADVRQVLDFTVRYFREQNLTYYRVLRREGYLRHLQVRRGIHTGELMVNLITTTQVPFDLTGYKEGLLALSLESDLVSILHTENDSLSDAVICDRLHILHGRDHIFETLHGRTFKISPFSFFQTNTRGAELLYGEVKAMISGRKREIFDLYCGTGTIAQMVADVGDKVIGVEIIPEAVDAARENVVRNGLDNVSFIAGDVKEVISTLEGTPDLIILDPPRSGVHPKALLHVLDFGAKEILYVSCNPKTLVQDLQVLQETGYGVVKSKIVDMFPNTAHVETVCLLTKK